MMIQRLFGTVALAAVGLVGLASTGSAEPLKAEVLHWWTSAGESLAVKQFAEAFNAAGGEWVDAAIAGGTAARQAAFSRIVAGDPPSANQFNTSRDFEDLIDKGLLRDLESFAEADHWRDVMPEALVNVSVRNGKFYALPVNIHGRNWIWYNQAVLDEAGAKVPTGWGEDMFAALDKVKAAGKIPLAISGTPVYETMVFHSVLLGTGGRDLWMAVYQNHDKDALMGAKMRKAFETFGRLRDYVDEGTPGRKWNVATNLVITGKAAFTSVGDWAKGEFSAAGMTAGKEYGCVVPGGVVLIGGDVFVFPKQHDPEKAEAQDLLVKVMSSPETLKAFNKFKGSIPSRTDVNMSGTDACAEKAMADLQMKSGRVPRMSMLVRADTKGEVEDIISEFFNDPSMTVDDAMKRHAEVLLGS